MKHICEVSDSQIRLIEENSEIYGKTVRITNGVVFVVVDITNSLRILEFGYDNEENILYQSSNTELNSGHSFNCFPNIQGEIKATNILFSSTQTGAVFSYVLDDIEFSMEVIMTLKHEDIMVLHSVKNNSEETKVMAIEASTDLRKDGILAIPQNTEQDTSRPNIILSFWPGTNPGDRRFTVGNMYIKLIKDNENRENIGSDFKFGMNNNSGSVFYIADSFLFSKCYVHDKEGLYPYNNCSFSSSLNKDYITLETCSPFYNIEPGMSVKHAEKWVISKRKFLPGAFDDEQIRKCIENL